MQSEKLQAELTARQSIEKLGSELASVQSEKLQAELTARQSIEKLGSELASVLSEARRCVSTFYFVKRSWRTSGLRAPGAPCRLTVEFKHKVWKP